jgi:TonB family protein
VYKSAELTQRVRLGHRPTPSLPAEALAKSVRGEVVLTAVFCKTGRVTDISVVEGLPYGVTERAIEAARQTEFTPAEKDGQRVSQATKFVFKFGYIGEARPLAQEPFAGRIIESIEVGGYDDKEVDKIWSRMKTRAGETYDKKLIEKDWRMLLSSGDFDRDTSTVRFEEGERGGLVLVFELKQRAKH